MGSTWGVDMLALYSWSCFNDSTLIAIAENSDCMHCASLGINSTLIAHYRHPRQQNEPGGKHNNTSHPTPPNLPISTPPSEPRTISNQNPQEERNKQINNKQENSPRNSNLQLLLHSQEIGIDTQHSSRSHDHDKKPKVQL